MNEKINRRSFAGCRKSPHQLTDKQSTRHNFHCQEKPTRAKRSGAIACGFSGCTRELSRKSPFRDRLCESPLRTLPTHMRLSPCLRRFSSCLLPGWFPARSSSPSMNGRQGGRCGISTADGPVLPERWHGGSLCRGRIWSWRQAASSARHPQIRDSAKVAARALPGAPRHHGRGPGRKQALRPRSTPDRAGFPVRNNFRLDYARRQAMGRGCNDVPGPHNTLQARTRTFVLGSRARLSAIGEKLRRPSMASAWRASLLPSSATRSEPRC